LLDKNYDRLVPFASSNALGSAVRSPSLFAADLLMNPVALSLLQQLNFRIA